ncbi:MAG: hypothetical protein AAF320_03335 [Myxococcota bacterium]
MLQHALDRIYTTHKGEKVVFEQDDSDCLYATVTEEFTGWQRQF